MYWLFGRMQTFCCPLASAECRPFLINFSGFPGSISIKSYKAKTLFPKEILSIGFFEALKMFFPHLVLVC